MEQVIRQIQYQILYIGTQDGYSPGIHWVDMGEGTYGKTFSMYDKSKPMPPDVTYKPFSTFPDKDGNGGYHWRYSIVGSFVVGTFIFDWTGENGFKFK